MALNLLAEGDFAAQGWFGYADRVVRRNDLLPRTVRGRLPDHRR